MNSLQIRNIDSDIFSYLRELAKNSNKRGVEPYVRELIQKHVKKAKFISDIEANHKLFDEYYGGPLSTNCVDMIREDRDA